MTQKRITAKVGRIGLTRRVVFSVLRDWGLIMGALMLSLLLAYNGIFWESLSRWIFIVVLPIAILAPVLVGWRRLYRADSRYVGIYDFMNIAFVGAILGATLLLLDSAVRGRPDVIHPLVAPILFSALSTGGLAGVRLLARIRAIKLLYAGASPEEMRRALIVGTGDGADLVLRELSKRGRISSRVVGFVDDDPERQDVTLHGLEVLGKVEDIPELVSKHNVDEVFIAIPNASSEIIRRIFKFCKDTEARIHYLPAFDAMVRNPSAMLPGLRNLELKDLLGRSDISCEKSQVANYISGERVLITGAGGSIGSELARQVARFTPASLVLAGKGENSIYEIEQELRRRRIFQPTPVICDVRDKVGIRSVVEEHYPSVVFHAAAHKHVPLMEVVPIEAIRNNIFGTLNIAEQAVNNGVKNFILVSTDKAVNPRNVMGATKRVAEMIVNAMAARFETEFAIVRFGNVLMSRGSFLPTIQRQIDEGGPVTITHPDMTRYFMSIPDAVQLILQSGAMGSKGEIFILDMGEAQSIVDLARWMIRMHGLVPGKDIEIKYTGVRPGEKIHEELAFEHEQLGQSEHERISKVEDVRPIDWETLKAQLDRIREICDSGDQDKARAALMELAWGKNLAPIPPLAGEVEKPQTSS